ncbi:hypothetical protein CEXT_632141 [Caerostris extrusa]|uniref:Uncharacterized protein n=1 Tax=Caerostris extrusa TaxID=172846 RepID=A0AAV4M416_CAEEX|nr:hypothetical protein CEXT_632141 [Caerostris extrusa]
MPCNTEIACRVVGKDGLPGSETRKRKECVKNKLIGRESHPPILEVVVVDRSQLCEGFHGQTIRLKELLI